MLQNSKSLSARCLKITALISMLLLSQWSWSQGNSSRLEENPTALAMTGDLIVVRPVMLVATVVGSALWLVSLPFSALGGNAMQAADTLVVGPAKATFMRCLGCTEDGYELHKEAL